MKIPSKISPSPLIEAITEIRFDRTVSSATLFARLYAELSDEFPQTEQLPILEIPEEMRERNPELRYIAHYRLKNEKFLINIGQQSLSINRICTDLPYSDWDEYFNVIKNTLKVFIALNVVENVENLSVRYVNFFENKLIESTLDLELNFLGENVNQADSLSVNILRKISEDKMLKIRINTQAKIKTNKIKKAGLVLDLEVSTERRLTTRDISAKITVFHEDVERAFFASLKPDFIKTLNPEYAQ